MVLLGSPKQVLPGLPQPADPSPSCGLSWVVSRCPLARDKINAPVYTCFRSDHGLHYSIAEFRSRHKCMHYL